MTTSQLIEKVLAQNESARGNDRLLIIAVWEMQGFYLSDTQKAKIMDIASPESIRRTRQKLNERGKYLPVEPIRKIRRFKGYQVQQSIPKTKPEKIEQLLNLPLDDQREPRWVV